MNIDNGLKEPLAHQKIIRKRKTFEQREEDDSNEPKRRCKKSRSLCSTLGEEVTKKDLKDHCLIRNAFTIEYMIH